MSDKYAYEDVRVVIRHDPDSSVEMGVGGTPHEVELPGTYVWGLEIDGAFFAQGSIPGGQLHNLIGHAKDEQESNGDDQQTAQPDASYSEREQELQRQLDEANARLRTSGAPPASPQAQPPGQPGQAGTPPPQQ